MLADVSRETCDRLRRFEQLVQEENKQQNLIARSDEDFWSRHIEDSVQLAQLGTADGTWVDVGSGAGLPGMVIACMLDNPVTLVEPRRLRAEFLQRVAVELRLPNVRVLASKAEQVAGKFEMITARAVAPLDRFLHLAHHLSHSRTIWVLPKGRNAASELAEAERNWQYDLRKVQSQTSAEATILVLSGVQAKAKR